ncbi:LLM class flavin-dependent oxidoreductase [Pseudonocardia acaciae]|uniref:LLM class flavin-dependent oxidoreductase n=1 Tax=Pseudonocardia acaciae TaxID=551276 RepID=UPI00048CF8B4|nr:LLM class flavin-dependent oxidoreductase [Pseudonocardia acaciae]
MEIGIGLPSTIPGTSARQILDWARAAEEHGFSSLGVIDRLVYGNTEPLVTLAAAAAVTTRIGLVTSVLIVPSRTNAALLAKQAATVNHLSAGRLTLGMAVGGYRDDYDASGVPFRERGKRFDAMLDDMAGIWAGEPRGFAGAIGPQPGIDRSRIIFGGNNDRAFARVATRGGGWIAGSSGVEAFGRGAERVRRAWTDHGRTGRPRLMALPYFSLGAQARANAAAYLGDHYAIEGARADEVVQKTLTDAETLRATVTAYDRAGCDELLLFPCGADPDQVRLLAEAVR